MDLITTFKHIQFEVSGTLSETEPNATTKHKRLAKCEKTETQTDKHHRLELPYNLAKHPNIGMFKGIYRTIYVLTGLPDKQ